MNEVGDNCKRIKKLFKLLPPTANSQVKGVLWLTGHHEGKKWETWALQALFLPLPILLPSLYTHNPAVFLRPAKKAPLFCYVYYKLQWCTDVCVWTMTCSHGICDPCCMSQQDTCNPPSPSAPRCMIASLNLYFQSGLEHEMQMSPTFAQLSSH